MKCAQIKNLIGETPDLQSIEQDQEISAHLLECSACKSFLSYEKALRKSFLSMANEAPPAQLAARIFAIPEQNQQTSQKSEPTGLLQLFFGLFAGFPLKTALVSCLIGFSAAIILQNQQNDQPQANRLKISKAPAINDPAKPEEANINHTEEIVLAQSEPALAPEIKTSIDTETTKNKIGGREAEIADEHIPGAISYSIAEEDSAPAKKAIVASDMRSARAPAPTMSIAEKSTDAFAETKKSFSSKSLVQKEDFAATPASPDPRCGELEALLENYAIQIEPGFLDLQMLAARGIIDSARLSHYSPPVGMAWYVEIENEKRRIFLKSEK